MKCSLLRLSLLFVFCLLVSVGCAGHPRAVRAASDTSLCPGEIGVASWYGKDFHGRKTSSGVVYDMHGLSAAHRTLPFGTLLRVTECKQGRSVQVTVNDRGPFVADRAIDLSFGAAKSLGIVADGVAQVGIQMIARGDAAGRPLPIPPATEGVATEREVASIPPPPPSGFVVQIGAYQIKDNALRVKEQIEKQHPEVYIETHENNIGIFHRVRIGLYTSEEEARSAADRVALHATGFLFGGETLHPVVVRAD